MRAATAAAAGVLAIACGCIAAPVSTAWPGTVHHSANAQADGTGNTYAEPQGAFAPLDGSGVCVDAMRSYFAASLSSDGVRRTYPVYSNRDGHTQSGYFACSAPWIRNQFM